jgi:hypothetical protein
MKIVGSFLLVAVTAFIANQFFLKSMEASEKNRDIANIFERNSQDQINWEQRRALEIAKDDLVSKSEKPNWMDQLAFEYLAGKYEFKITDGIIKFIDLKENVLGQRFDTQQFLDQYVKKMLDFSSFKITHVDSNVEIADLYSDQGSRVGSMTIHRDSDSRVTQIKVE